MTLFDYSCQTFLHLSRFELNELVESSCMKYKKFHIDLSCEKCHICNTALNIFCSQVMPVHSRKAELKWKVPEEAKCSLCYF